MDDLAGAAAQPLSAAATELEAALPTARRPTPLPPTPEAGRIAAIEGTEPSAPLPGDGLPGDGLPGDGLPGDGPPGVDARPATLPEHGKSPDPPPTSGLMVSRARVLAAAKAGIRPSGSAVGATAWRPSGLALVSVGGVGVGLRDGDVVTRVGGARATSQGAVIGAVTAALRQKLPAITAEVWRGRHRIVVTVGLPEVELDDVGRDGAGS